MHLDGTGLAQHADQRALGVAAHDRVVDHDQSLAADHLAQRVELEPDTELADRLRRLDERPADVGVLHQTLAVGDAGFLRVSHCCRGPRLGHPDHQIGVDGLLPCQPPTDVDPGAVHGTPGQRAVGAGEVDVLEHTVLR